MPRQCPNCNGYEVSDETIFAGAKNGRRLNENHLGFKAGLIIVVIFATWLLATIAYFPYGMALVGTNRNNEWIVIGPVVTAFLLCMLLVRILIPRVLFRSLGRYALEHHYSCDLCEFTWRWKLGKPYPYPPGTCLAHNAAELRRLGEARLAEQRQRNAQNAGYFIIQQRHRSNKSNP